MRKGTSGYGGCAPEVKVEGRVVENPAATAFQRAPPESVRVRRRP